MCILISVYKRVGTGILSPNALLLFLSSCVFLYSLVTNRSDST